MPGRAAITLRSEFDLLLACVRWHVSSPADHDAAALCGGVRWDRVLQLAARHHVTPLLATALRACRSTTLPDGLPARLDLALRLNSAKNLKAAARGNAVVRLFDAAGIGSLCFKGPTLAVLAYGSLSIRTFDDLDILVRPDDVERAWTVLEGAGFESDVAATLSRRRAQAALRRPVTFVHRRDGVTIDLHSSVTPGYQPLRIDTGRLIDEGTTIDILGQAVRTLRPEMLLVLLGAHGAKHMWERLSWVADIAALLHRRRDLDWERADALAGRWHCRRALHVACALARRLLHAPVAPEWHGVRQMRGHGDALVEAAYARLVDPDDRLPSTFALAHFHLATMDRWRDRARYVAAMMHPSEADAADADTPRLGRALRYPRRAIRLLVRGPAGAPAPIAPVQDR